MWCSILADPDFVPQKAPEDQVHFARNQVPAFFGHMSDQKFPDVRGDNTVRHAV